MSALRGDRFPETRRVPLDHDRFRALAREASARGLSVLAGLQAAVDDWLAADYALIRAQERERIVWWLRAGIAGPAAVNASEEYLKALTELADVIERHPERFAEAPTKERS